MLEEPMSQTISLSGQLSSFRNMSLGSQNATQEPPPVPLFAETGTARTSLQLPGPSQQLPGPSQQDYLGSQPDFITPVDQFQLEYDPANKDARHQRSPAHLSPNRIKRPRKAGEEGDGKDSTQDWSQPRSSGGAGPSGRGMAAAGNPYGQAQARRALVRPQSPPCLHNVFGEEGEEEGQAVRLCAARAVQPQQAQCLSRFRFEFRETGILGQGSFSKVFRARHRMDGQEYAVKRSISEVEAGSPQFAQFVQEVQALAALPPHPNIVQYFSSWREPGNLGGEHLYIQTERCDATLAAHASLGDQLREHELLELLQQVCSALAHIHRHGIAHMDVKPDNIYLRHDDGGATTFKLGDFGQATRADGRGAAMVNEGDSRYLPHEVLNGCHGRLDKADMFSLGITLYELATGAVGSLPSGGQLYQDLRTGRLGLMPGISMSLHKMIKALLSPEPTSRPSAEKVLASGLFKKLQQRQQHNENEPLNDGAPQAMAQA